MIRAVDVVRFGAGALDVFTTRRQAGLELGSPALPRDLVVYRLLGVRQAVQAVVIARTEWRALGGAVDLLHLASMLPVAVLSRRWRRAALVQIGFAALMLVRTRQR